MKKKNLKPLIVAAPIAIRVHRLGMWYIDHSKIERSNRPLRPANVILDIYLGVSFAFIIPLGILALALVCCCIQGETEQNKKGMEAAVKGL